MTKRALVVGIDDYRQWQGVTTVQFPALRWCAEDAVAFGNTLTTALGFTADNINVCLNSEATMEAIVGGLTTMMTQSQPGDVACFYFAGHGGRAPEHGWGTPGARFYETIVPYDSAGMVFDYQFADLAHSLLPPAVNLTLVLDTGHTGVLSPADAVVSFRGHTWSAPMQDQFVAQCQAITPIVCLADPSALDGNIHGPQRAGSGVTVTAEPAASVTGQARALLLAACDYSEMAGESANFRHGYLTNALLETMNQSDLHIKPVDLLAAVAQKVSSYSGARQTPRLRGRPAQSQEMFLDPLTDNFA